MLSHALGDERRHCDTFARAMRERRIVQCNMLQFWGVGGTILGLFTSLLGRDAILVCTEAVERTVHRHMDDQVDWLAIDDGPLSGIIAAIRDEEVDHLHNARAARTTRPGALLRALDQLVAGATELLVWLATYGESSRLRDRIGRLPEDRTR